MFNFKEFIELPEEDIPDWWTENKLPHPGCPTSFKMMLDLVRVLHRWDETERKISLLRCVGQVKYHYTNKDFSFFFFPYKDRSLVIPLDRDYQDTNWSLIAMIFGRYV